MKVFIQDQDFKRSPHAELARLNAHGPFVEGRIPIFGKTLFATTHEAATTMLKSPDLFAVDGRNAGAKRQFPIPFLPKTIRLLGANMLSQDDPDHRRIRKLCDAPFRKVSIDALRPAIGNICDELLTAAEGDGEVELVQSFCRQFPLAVICEMLGLSDEKRRKFMAWMDFSEGATSAIGMILAMPRLKKVVRDLREEIEDVRGNPRPGLISDLVHAEEDGEQLSEDELLAAVLILFVAGHETTTHLLSTSVRTLLTDGAARETLTADWSGVETAVEELHRYNSPVQMTKPRWVRCDCELMGVPLKQRQAVVALLAAANVDPDVFDEPLALKLDRKPNRHVGFGGGPHLCLGLHLARAETQVALQQIFTRWPDLSLAVPDADLSWSKRYGLRGLKALPVKASAMGRRLAA